MSPRSAIVWFKASPPTLKISPATRSAGASSAAMKARAASRQCTLGRHWLPPVMVIPPSATPRTVSVFTTRSKRIRGDSPNTVESRSTTGSTKGGGGALPAAPAARPAPPPRAGPPAPPPPPRRGRPAPPAAAPAVAARPPPPPAAPRAEQQGGEGRPEDAAPAGHEHPAA